MSQTNALILLIGLGALLLLVRCALHEMTDWYFRRETWRRDAARHQRDLDHLLQEMDRYRDAD